MSLSQDGDIEIKGGTGYDKDKLLSIAKATVEIPDHIKPH